MLTHEDLPWCDKLSRPGRAWNRAYTWSGRDMRYWRTEMVEVDVSDATHAALRDWTAYLFGQAREVQDLFRRESGKWTELDEKGKTVRPATFLRDSLISYRERMLVEGVIEDSEPWKIRLAAFNRAFGALASQARGGITPTLIFDPVAVPGAFPLRLGVGSAVGKPAHAWGPRDFYLGDLFGWSVIERPWRDALGELPGRFPANALTPAEIEGGFAYAEAAHIGQRWTVRMVVAAPRISLKKEARLRATAKEAGTPVAEFKGQPPASLPVAAPTPAPTAVVREPRSRSLYFSNCTYPYPYPDWIEDVEAFQAEVTADMGNFTSPVAYRDSVERVLGQIAARQGRPFTVILPSSLPIPDLP